MFGDWLGREESLLVILFIGKYYYKLFYSIKATNIIWEFIYWNVYQNEAFIQLVYFDLYNPNQIPIFFSVGTANPL